MVYRLSFEYSAIFGTVGVFSLSYALSILEVAVPATFYTFMLVVNVLAPLLSIGWSFPFYSLLLPAFIALIYYPTEFISSAFYILLVKLRLQLSKFEEFLLAASVFYFTEVAVGAVNSLQPDNSFNTMSSIACIGVIYVSGMGILGGHLLNRRSLHFSVRAAIYATICISLMLTHMYFAFNSFGRLSPLLWILQILLDHDGALLKICLYWAGILAVFLPLLQYVTLTFPQLMKNIIARKLFHFLSVLLFAPIILHSADFMCLAFAVSLCALLLIEFIRCGNIFDINSTALGRYFDSFIDERDRQRGIAVTHIYLLIGCALPCWIFALLGQPSSMILLPHIGWITIGIGDAMGAVVGSSIGKHRYSSTNARTVEGSVGALCSMLLAAGTIYMVHNTNQVILAHEACAAAAALVGGTVLEAFTLEIDNLIVPLYATVLYLLTLAMM